MTEAGRVQDTEAPAPRKVGFLSPLRRSSVRRLLFGQTVSRIGDSFYFVALPWLILRASGTSISLSLVLGTAAATMAVFTLLGGVLADRFGPRRLMLSADTLRLAVVTVLAVTAFTAVPPLWLLIALAALLGIGTGLFYPASAAMIPHLVPEEELQPANSFDQLTMQASNFLGPSIAGAVLAATRLAVGFAIDALSFLISVISLFMIHMPERSRAATARMDGGADGAAPQGGLASMGEAFRFLRASAFLSALIALSLLANFAVNGLFDVATPLLLKQWVGLAEGPRALGFVISGFGIGSIIGAVAGGLATRIPHKPLVAVVSILPASILMAGMPFAGGVLPLAVIAAGMGIFFSIVNVLFITVIQRFIPLEMMGRMMGFVMLGSVAGTPLSIFAYGLAASVVPNIAALFVIGGALLAAAGLLALTRRVIWTTQ